MSTSFDQTPTFEERLMGAELIIIGWVEKPIDTIVDYQGEEAQVQTLFLVKVEDVLKGKLDKDTIILRVVGGSRGDQKSSWTTRVNEGGRMLLVISKYYGSDRSEEMYVPYFDSSFPVSDENEVSLEKHLLDEFKSRKVPVKQGKIALSTVRSMVEVVVKHKSEQRTRFSEMEPPEFLQRPYAEVQEMPKTDYGGGVSAGPEIPEH